MAKYNFTSPGDWAAARVLSVAMMSGHGAGMAISMTSLVQLAGSVEPALARDAAWLVILAVALFGVGGTLSLSVVTAAYSERREAFVRRFNIAGALLGSGIGVAVGGLCGYLVGYADGYCGGLTDFGPASVRPPPLVQ